MASTFEENRPVIAERKQLYSSVTYLLMKCTESKLLSYLPVTLVSFSFRSSILSFHLLQIIRKISIQVCNISVKFSQYQGIIQKVHNGKVAF